MTDLAVNVRNVTHRYGAFTALNDVSLEVPTGTYTVFLGPSGSGKTTLLSVIGGFLTPDIGQVVIKGQDMTSVAPARRPTTTVFQDYALFPHMSILANVAFGLRMRGVKGSERNRRAAAMLDLVGLSHQERKKPHELSGGQRQRVALARALAVEPTVLLLDEPLGALDLKLRHQMQAELKGIQREVKTSFIHVTHDQEEAMAIGDTVVVMNTGKIEDLGPPERVYLEPKTLFAAGFMGQSSFLVGRVADLSGSEVFIETACGRFNLSAKSNRFTSGDAVMVSIRPEHFVTGPSFEGEISLGRGRIETLTFAGTHHLAQLSHLEVGGFRPVIKLPQTDCPNVGELIEIRLKARNAVVLPATR